MAVMTYREALNLALREELKRDPDVFVIGEEVGLYEGAYKVTQGLLREFGPKRIVDTPIAESGFTGVGIGAAMTGLRPVVEMMTFNFALLALDQIVNSAAKLHYMSGGQFHVPIVIRGPGGPANHDRHVELSARHVMELGGRVHDLVEGEQGEVERHHLDHGPEPRHGGADADASESGLRDRRVDHPLGTEVLQESLRYLVGALVQAHFLAHHEHARVTRHLLAE